jgi:uncharacterized membrane protein
MEANAPRETDGAGRTDDNLGAPVGPERMIGLSDAVIAVVITIMVLQFAVPAGNSLGDLVPLIPTLGAYALSFTFVGTYWVNHHHLIRATVRVDGAVMWANLDLLFWLSLMPFATSWFGHHIGQTWPTFFYGLLCLITGAAYTILVRAIVRANPGQLVARRLAHDIKGIASLVLYAIGCSIALFQPFVSLGVFVVVAVIWFIPDRRLTAARSR